MKDKVHEALARLFVVAMRDTGQSHRVANFLLAWHCAEENGGWDLTDLWVVDAAIADDMLAVVEFIRRHNGKYPGETGFDREIQCVWKLWRGGAR